MAEVSWDAGSGALRLPLAHLAELGRLSLSGSAAADATDRGGAPLRADLEAAGCLAGTQLDPQLAAIARAVARPLGHLSLDVQTREELRACPGWVSAELAVLAVPATPGSTEGAPHDVVSVPPPQLPRRLGGLVGLGPRPRAMVVGAVELDGRDLAVLLRDGGAAALDVDDGAWRTALELLGAEFRVQWRASARWTGPQGPAGRMCTVVDGGSWWLVEPSARSGAVRLVATDATAVWGLLTTLLPRSGELGAPA